VERAEKIYGASMTILQGKMKRVNPMHHPKTTALRIPDSIRNKYKDLIMAIDIFFVNGIPFLVTKTEKFNYLTAMKLNSRSIAQIIKAINWVFWRYNEHGFSISDIHANNEFDSEKLEHALLPCIMHIYAANKHVGFIENGIKTIKERARCTCSTVPYKRFTRAMTEALIQHVVNMLNSFPSKNRVSDLLSPDNLVEGRHNVDMGTKRLEFGSYAMVYVGTKK